jgi:hypothetical protein
VVSLEVPPSSSSYGVVMSFWSAVLSPPLPEQAASASATATSTPAARRGIRIMLVKVAPRPRRAAAL